MSKQEANALVEETEELMVSSNGSKTPNLKIAHFLKPTLDPIHQTLPKPPPHFLSPKPIINQVNYWVSFVGRPKPRKNWDFWVGNLQQTHQATWEKVGIYNAIKVSTYKIWGDNELIIKLSEKWCPVTNTFMFPWGESTITLEDIMILGGFSVLGNCVKPPIQIAEAEENDNILTSVLPKIRKSNGREVAQNDWMNYFMGIGGELEHMAFLALWLSRYVFSSSRKSEISPSVFPLAISLARGNQIALAPAVLASIYRDLSLLKRKIVGHVNGSSNDICSQLIIWAPFQFVQLWAWERFPTLCPKPITLLQGEPRLARWQNLTRMKNKLAMDDFESLGESFLWRPYALFTENWQFPKFYGDEERLVLVNSEVGEELMSFARCLRPCELVGLDCIEQYLPHRVGRQFGFDQDIPSSVCRFDGTIKLSWSSYDIPLDGVNLFLAPRLLKGDVTVRYLDWSKRASCLDNTSASVFKLRKSPRNLPGGARFERLNSIDAVVKVNNVTSSCNAPLVSCTVHSFEGMHIEATLSSDRNNNLSKSHVDDAMQIPSLEIAINKAVNGIDSLIEKLKIRKEKCVDLSNNMMVDSLAEMHNETVPSCDKITNPTAVNELASSMNSPLAGNNRMDSLIEKLENCREICVNMSFNKRVDSITEIHNDSLPSCDKNISTPCRGHENCSFEGVPSQSTEMVVFNEADAHVRDEPLTDAENADVECLMGLENRKKNNCSFEGIPSQSTERVVVDEADAWVGDEALTDVDNVDVSEAECLMHPNIRKRICFMTTDEEGEESKNVNVKSKNGLVDDQVIIIDDDEDEKGNGDFNPFGAIDSELEARLCKLENVVSWLQAGKSGSKTR